MGTASKYTLYARRRRLPLCHAPTATAQMTAVAAAHRQARAESNGGMVALPRATAIACARPALRTFIILAESTGGRRVMFLCVSVYVCQAIAPLVACAPPIARTRDIMFLYLRSGTPS